MKKEEIMELGLEELEARSLEIADETKEADEQRLGELNEELDAIEERKNALAEISEQRKKDIEDIVKRAEGEVLESEKREEKNDMEVRNTPEYINAYAEYLKTGNDEECRALLTEMASDGTIAVPVVVEDKINTAWESNELVKLVRKTNFKGVLRVGYEASASGAVVHEEGDEAIAEENLVVNYVTLVPQMIKKMVRFSDEVMDMKGQAFLDYIFDEIEYHLVKLAGDMLISQVATATAGPLVAESEAAGASLTTADIITAQGLLGAEASNPILFITRSDAAALKADALSAHYGYDPFDGLQVIYTDAAAMPDALAVIADPSAFQINMPNGNAAQFKFDELTEADADMVRVIGRLYAGLGIVAPGRAVRIVAGE